MSANTPDSLDFRPADPAHLEQLASLRVEAMRPSLEGIGRFDPERARSRLVDGFSPEHTREIWQGPTRVGFFVLKPGPDHLLLEHLYIRPSHQGRGIGGAVLRAVFAQADAAGLDVRVGALRDSDANRFYARHGFVLVGRTEFDNHYVRTHRRATKPPA